MVEPSSSAESGLMYPIHSPSSRPEAAYIAAGRDAPPSFLYCSYLFSCIGHTNVDIALAVIREIPERPIDERSQIPAIDVLIGRLAGGVVAAWQHLREMIDAQPLKVGEHIERELAQEGEVVGRVDDENALGVAANRCM